MPLPLQGGGEDGYRWLLPLVAVERAYRVYHVSPTGSDTNPGTTALPWRTVEKAATTAQEGDVVVFANGVYDLGNGQYEWNSGTEGNPIVFRARNRRQAIWEINDTGWAIGIEGQSYLRFEGLMIKGDVDVDRGRFVTLEDADHITFHDCEIGWAQGHVLALWGGCTNIEISDCEIHSENPDIFRDTIHIRNSGNKDILIEDTEVYHSGHAGIDINAGERITVRNCNVHHNGSHGISVGAVVGTSIPLRGIIIEHNQAHHSGGWAGEEDPKMGIRAHLNAEEVDIWANTVYENNGPGIQVNSDAIGPVEIRHNTLWANDLVGSDWGSVMVRRETRWTTHGAPRIILHDNIIYHTEPTYALYCESSADTELTSDYNVWFGERGLTLRCLGEKYLSAASYEDAGVEPNSIFDDPQLVQLPNAVLDEDSPALDAASDGYAIGAWQPDPLELPDRP